MNDSPRPVNRSKARAIAIPMPAPAVQPEVLIGGLILSALALTPLALKVFSWFAQ